MGHGSWLMALLLEWKELKGEGDSIHYTVFMLIWCMYGQMMTVAPEKRPTAAQALGNPWVMGNTAQDTHLKRTQDRIREFNAKRKFKVGELPIQLLTTHTYNS